MAEFTINKDSAGVPRVVWFSMDLIAHLHDVRQVDIDTDNYKTPRDIVYIYFRARCYLAWLQQRLGSEKRPDHIRALEYHQKTTERRLAWLSPYVLPALQFIDDPETRARCVRMVWDFDPAERCDTYNDPDYPDNTDPYNMIHPYNPDLMPILRDLSSDLAVNVGSYNTADIIRPAHYHQLPPGYKILALPSGDGMAIKE